MQCNANCQDLFRDTSYSDLLSSGSYPERDLRIPNCLRGQDGLARARHPMQDEELPGVQLRETEFDPF